MKHKLILLFIFYTSICSGQVAIRAVSSQQKNNARLLPSDLISLFSVLYLGDISGNALTDVIGGNDFTITGKDFSTNYIPATSTATFSLSNNAALKVDDGFDGAWFDDAGTSKQLTVTQLLNNDFSRTLIKFSNIAPYDIQWIGLLDDAATPTNSQWNRLHTYFQLHLYWSGVFNDFGVQKENIPPTGRGYKGWSAQVASLSLTLPSESVKSSLNKVCIDINNYSYVSGLNRMWVFMLNDNTLVNGAGTVSLISPESSLFTFPVAPTYTINGFVGDGSTQYGSTNFNPSSNGPPIYTLNSASRGMYIYTSGGGYFDGHIASPDNVITNSNNSGLHRINSGTNFSGGVDMSGSGYRAINRSSATTTSIYNDLTKSDWTTSSSGLANENLTVLRSTFGYGTAGISMYYIGRSFTQSEHSNIRTIFLSHKTRLGL